MGSGTLYEAIQRLRKRAWIEEVPAPRSEGGRSGRRFYTLTAEGRAGLEKELARLDRIVRYARDKDLISKPKTA